MGDVSQNIRMDYGISDWGRGEKHPADRRAG